MVDVKNVSECGLHAQIFNQNYDNVKVFCQKEVGERNEGLKQILFVRVNSS